MGGAGSGLRGNPSTGAATRRRAIEQSIQLVQTEQALGPSGRFGECLAEVVAPRVRICLPATPGDHYNTCALPQCPRSTGSACLLSRHSRDSSPKRESRHEACAIGESFVAVLSCRNDERRWGRSAWYVVKAPNLQVRISASEGKILGIKLGSETTERPVTGETVLAGCRWEEHAPNASPTAASNSRSNLSTRRASTAARSSNGFSRKKTASAGNSKCAARANRGARRSKRASLGREPEKSLFWTAWGDPRPNGNRLDESPAPGRMDGPRVPVRRT